jgi:hypothetical protein
MATPLARHDKVLLVACACVMFLSSLWCGAVIAGGSPWALGSSAAADAADSVIHPTRLRGGHDRRLQGDSGGAPAELIVRLVSNQVIWIIFGVIYYSSVVSKYPKLQNWNERSRAFQNKNACAALFDTKGPNIALSWCCIAPRAAHTFDSAGVMDYWPGLILMTCFPQCTLCLVQSFTELSPRLGGEKKNPCVACLCSCCCAICVTAQDAESLDLATGAKTNFCSVDAPDARSMRPGQPGMEMGPGQMQMQPGPGQT